MTWVDHQDLECSIEEHHEHEALGSTALRQLYTAQEPTQASADMGNAVGWLAVLAGSFFCSLSEAALLSSREGRIRSRMELGDKVPALPKAAV